MLVINLFDLLKLNESLIEMPAEAQGMDSQGLCPPLQFSAIVLLLQDCRTSAYHIPRKIATKKSRFLKKSFG
jgi:hypothetical protein